MAVMQQFQKILIDKNSTVKDAMKQLDTTAEKILFVVGQNNKLVGSLTDGDIRRWILKDGSLSELIVNVCFKDTYFVTSGYDYEEVKSEILQRRIVYVPIVDNNRIVQEFLVWDKLFDGKIKRKVLEPINIPVVIMAGGKGTRLDPFTKILPKPLIPIGEKTILELIIDKFVDFGVTDFTLAVNYKARIIKSYLEEISPDYNISYIDEDIPLGTAGSLGLLDTRNAKCFFVTNCDIIISADYSEILQFHNENMNDITVVASLKHVKIPYGVCKLGPEGLLDSIDEKPENDYLISTGMYIVNSDLLDLIPKDSVYHMTNLIEDANNIGKRIGVFPISENSWIDTGEWVEYKKALEKFV